jgi:hypothetical protein
MGMEPHVFVEWTVCTPLTTAFTIWFWVFVVVFYFFGGPVITLFTVYSTASGFSMWRSWSSSVSIVSDYRLDDWDTGDLIPGRSKEFFL